MSDDIPLVRVANESRVCHEIIGGFIVLLDKGLCFVCLTFVHTGLIFLVLFSKMNGYDYE